MPIFDLPLEELKSYEGTNPRPEDFDDYWEKAIAEMQELFPEVELVPSDFQVPFADCFHLYFNGVRGARIHAKYVRPKENKHAHPALLQFHGYSGSSGQWSEKLCYAAMGFSVAALDCRGQGGLSEDPGGVKGNTLHGHIIRGLADGPEKLLFRDLFLDAAQLARIVMSFPEVDEERVGAMGGSQGGGLTLACGALEPRVKRLAPAYPFLSDYKRVWDLDLAENAYGEIREYLRRFDPTHEREEEFFWTLGYIDVQNLAGRIQGEVLMAVTLMDQICPPSTQFAAYNKIKAPKQFALYPDYGHEALPDFCDRTLQFMMEL